MLQAVAGMIFGGPAAVREVACAACGAGICRFEARPQETLS
jgi:predicted hydrocarbon binding protein